MHKSNGGFEFWDTQKEKVVKMYVEQNLSCNKIAKEYKCDPSTISRQLDRWNISKRKRYNALYKFNEHYFKQINTEQKAYWIGVLLSDGHLSKGEILMLFMKDLDVIEKFKNCIEAEQPIKVDKYGTPGICISSRVQAQYLRDIGFHNRKSWNVDIQKILSHIPQHLTRHFLRGVFDGDGSIKVYNYEYLKKPQYHFGITGTLQVTEFVKDFLNITNSKLVKEGPYTYTCRTRDIDKIKEIYNVLYKDATVYMERKYDTFQTIINL